MTEKTAKEIKEIEKGIAQSTKLAHKILEMLKVNDKIPKKSLISILMILHLMIEKDNKFTALDKNVMNHLSTFGITIEDPEIGN